MEEFSSDFSFRSCPRLSVKKVPEIIKKTIIKLIGHKKYCRHSELLKFTIIAMGRKELILVPENAEIVLTDTDTLSASLQNIGFIGDAFEFFEGIRYRPGEQFYDFIEFVNSHPIILLEPKDGTLVPSEVTDSRYHCTIYVRSDSETPQFLGGPPTMSPLCRHCSYEENEWGDMLSDWFENQTLHRWKCPGCGFSQRVYDLDWRDGAALGCFEIVIDRIRFREAIPKPSLLEKLHSATGFAWKYFYYDDTPTNWRP